MQTGLDLVDPQTYPLSLRQLIEIGQLLAKVLLQQMARDAGRGPIPVTSYPRKEAAEIERHQAAGVERGIFYVSSENRDAALRQLDELTKLVEPYQG